MFFKNKKLEEEIKKLKKENKKLKEENSKIWQENFRLKLEKKDPSKIVESILGREINWFNYKELSVNDWAAYYQDAKMILNNSTFKNEINHLFDDLVKHLAYKSKDFNEVRDIRMTINGIKLLLERLESISPPEKIRKVTNPFEPV